MGFSVSRVLTVSVLSIMAHGFISPVWSVDPESYRKRFCPSGAVAQDQTVYADLSLVELSDRMADDSKAEAELCERVSNGLVSRDHSAFSKLAEQLKSRDVDKLTAVQKSVIVQGLKHNIPQAVGQRISDRFALCKQDTCNKGHFFYIGQRQTMSSIQSAIYYYELASNAIAEAAYYLAEIYKNGAPGVMQDYAKAHSYYTKALRMGYVKAGFDLFFLYSKGKGVEQNNAMAISFITQAADAGYSKAQYSLGWYFENGNMVECDRAKALDWYRKSAQQGEEKAHQRLDALDFGSAAAAAARDEEAQSDEEEITDVDPAVALDSLLREMLCNGKDVSSQLSVLVNEIVSDYRESYEPSSEPNDVEFEAAVKQANDLITRNSGLQNLACLAEKGHRAAMMSLFVTYAYGLVGDNVNVPLSAKWFAKLLEANPESQFSKALMHLVGFLTYEKDENLALDLLIDGALKGDVESQYFLGMLHINGKGGANKNDVVAWAWFIRAVQNDYQAAKPILINMPLCH